MPIAKLRVDDRISDWYNATNDIIDEINNGIGDRTQLVTQSKVIVSAINTLGGPDFWTEPRLADGAVTTEKFGNGAVNTYKIENNPEFNGTYSRLPSGLTSERPYQGSAVSSVFYNGDANEEFVITGNGFDPAGVQITLVGTDNSEVSVSNVTVVSSHIVKFLVPQTLDPTLKPYSVKLVNNNISGQPEVVSTGVLNFGGGPVWTSRAVIGDFEDYQSHLKGNVQFFLDARDPDHKPLDYSLVSGSLPANATIFNSGTVNIPECPPQYVAYNSPTAFSFIADADDGVNPPVNSGTLQINVRPSSPASLLSNNTVRAWFSGASWNAGVWQDMTGNGYDTISQRGTVSSATWSGTDTWGVSDYDANRNFKYIQGSTADGLLFPPEMTPSVDQTYFIVARYTDPNDNQGRIFLAKPANLTLSHWGEAGGSGRYPGNAGATHWNHWVASNENRNDYLYNHEENWIIWAGNINHILTNGRKINTRGGAAGVVEQMGINLNDGSYPGGNELSSWACAEFIVVDGNLSEAEMRNISHMLGWRYGIPMSSKVGNVPRVGLVHAPANRALGVWEDDLPLTINWGATTWSVAGNATYPLPDWADGALGTLNINTNQGAPTNDVGITNQYLVTDRPTIIRLYRNSGWNTVNDFGHSLSTYTRRTDLEAIWTGAPFSSTDLEIYEKYVEAGVYSLDCDSAMFQFFAPDPDTDVASNQPTLLESAVIWSKQPQ